MKTKDFIKMLQEADPEGEAMVMFSEGGLPWFAEWKPGYYDGDTSWLIKNENGYPIGIETSRSYKGGKLVIHEVDLQELAWLIREDNPTAEPIIVVDKEENNPYIKDHDETQQKKIRKIRDDMGKHLKEAADCLYSVLSDSIRDWICQKEFDMSYYDFKKSRENMYGGGAIGFDVLNFVKENYSKLTECEGINKELPDKKGFRSHNSVEREFFDKHLKIEKLTASNYLSPGISSTTYTVKWKTTA